MTPPSPGTRLLGHPIVVLPTGGLCLLSICVFTQNTQSWPMLLISCLTMTKIMEANKRVTAYQSWKAAWDSMADAPSRRRRSVGPLFAVGVIAALILLVIYAPYSAAWAAGFSVGWVERHPVVPAALVCSVILWLFIRWISRRPRRQPRAMTVAVIAKPILPVPDLKTAYQSLPDYARHLMERQA